MALSHLSFCSCPLREYRNLSLVSLLLFYDPLKILLIFPHYFNKCRLVSQLLPFVTASPHNKHGLLQIVLHTVLGFTESKRTQSTLASSSEVLFLHCGKRKFQILQCHHFPKPKPSLYQGWQKYCELNQ